MVLSCVCDLQVVPVPENQLPVVLPTEVEFKGRGASPLTQDADWLRGDCGKSVIWASGVLLLCVCVYVCWSECGEGGLVFFLFLFLLG